MYLHIIVVRLQIKDGASLDGEPQFPFLIHKIDDLVSFSTHMALSEMAALQLSDFYLFSLDDNKKIGDKIGDNENGGDEDEGFLEDDLSRSRVVQNNLGDKKIKDGDDEDFREKP